MNREPIKPASHSFTDDGKAFPNNPKLSVLYYNHVFDTKDGSIADQFEKRFHKNGWTGTWRWSVYEFHHFHSDAHEALGVASGQATLQLGGPQGESFEVSAGDLIVLPAGTGHKKLGCTRDFQVVGAYPQGQEHYATNRGDPVEYESALEAIAATPLPETDPLYGKNGPLVRLWAEN